MAKSQNENRTKKRGARKPKPAYTERPEFIIFPHSDMLPLYPEGRALDAAKAAFETLRTEYPDFLSRPAGGISQNEDKQTSNDGTGLATSTESLEASLRDIAHLYWFKRRVYEQKPSEEFNSKLVEIREIAEKLRNALASATPLARNQLICGSKSRPETKNQSPYHLAILISTKSMTT
jgi:hypothetical protein